MGDFKGTGIVYVRKLVREQDASVEQALLARLSPAEATLFQTTMAGSWLSIESATKILDATAATCYPGDPEGLRRVGRGMALDNLKGVYRMLVRLATIPFIIKQSAILWETYHREGRAHSEARKGENAATFTVEEYPEMPERFREMMCGYVAGAIELTGAGNIRVTRRDGIQGTWHWDIRWE